MSIPLPANLPLLLSEASEVGGEFALQGVTNILQGKEENLENILVTLGRYWKIKVWFDHPIAFPTRSRMVKLDDNTRVHKHTETTDCYTFNSFFKSSSAGACYSISRRRGYPFRPYLDRVVRYEPLLRRPERKEFQSYEEFKARFDPLFISEEELQGLWNGTSAQHGGKYNKTDFHRFGPEGLYQMKLFLRNFKGVGTGGEGCPGYYRSRFFEEPIYVLSEQHHSLGKGTFGRDIRISHQTNLSVVHYTSEHAGGGRERSGLVANAKEFLWLADD